MQPTNAHYVTDRRLTSLAHLLTTCPALADLRYQAWQEPQALNREADAPTDHGPVLTLLPLPAHLDYVGEAEGRQLWMKVLLAGCTAAPGGLTVTEASARHLDLPPRAWQAAIARIELVDLSSTWDDCKSHNPRAAR
jgi:hypothetical protein